MRRDERGQAMVIGAVAMLVLAISVMASVSIGHGVYEKIKLQDAADAQAYSFAVKEARAYNFLAYTNRAMIVHYSAMLTVMSYVSHAMYLDQTVRAAASVLKAVPGIGAIFAAVEQAIRIWKTAVETVSRVLIPILTGLNVALWLAQEAMMLGTLKDLYMYKGSLGPFLDTDPKSRSGFDGITDSSGSNSVITIDNFNFSNMKNFLHAIDDGPHSSETSFNLTDPTGLRQRSKLLRDNALSDPDMAKYRLLMGNLANAVRREWTAVGTGPFLIGRKWDFNLCLLIGQVRIDKTADSQIKSFSEDFENNRKDQLFASDDIKIDVRAGCFGILPWKTVFELRFRAAADARNGFHQQDGGSKTDRHHDWMGITPFLTSDTSFIDPWQNHFSYPCNVIMLTKDMMPRGRQPFQMENLSRGTFRDHRGSRDEAFTDDDEGISGGMLDMTWQAVGGVQNIEAEMFRDRSGGMMAIAVGRAIYHRPGDWKEEPNFFNPLWTARLAPVRTHWEGDLLQQLIPEWEITDKAFTDALSY
ncbi:TadE/TadG family type IV pilus assembly protein [Pyxidicoccus sp. 3LFB2]